MSFATLGLIGLIIAFVTGIISVVLLVWGALLNRHTSGSNIALVGSSESAASTAAGGRIELAGRLKLAGHLAVILNFVALSCCCAVLLYCFISGDFSIQYVAQYCSGSDSSLAWLYKISGLWAGRGGSLLFWGWLISAFNLVIAIGDIRRLRKLDSLALAVSQLVALALLAVLVFSPENMPFAPTPLQYLAADGTLSGAAANWGLSPLLEHWAMAVHPPTLFVGYAGLTIPFAYALAALISNDDSSAWVHASNRFALIAWLFLGLGIGLGAIWAYVVLGWGGYWGWDPVENASLLSWILSVALIHSFTVYRQRGAFKRWSVMAACLAFAFVIVGTFISRSDIVQSVHAFEAAPLSSVVFLVLIVMAVAAGGLGLLWRRQSFANTGDFGAGEQLLTRDNAYFFNNFVMLLAALLITYMTVAPALPTWLPFGGQSFSAVAYNAMARPLGILYCALMAVCPLIAWGCNDRVRFLRHAKPPALFAGLLFAGLMVYFVCYLVPSYDASVASLTASAVSSPTAGAVFGAGPRWYYFLLTVLGFLVAALLFFNSLVLLGRQVRRHVRLRRRGCNGAVGSNSLASLVPQAGGLIAHLAVAVILVGLISSSMYVTETTGYVAYDEQSGTATNDFTIQDFTLKYAGSNTDSAANGNDVSYSVSFDVYRSDQIVGQVSPSIRIDAASGQRQLSPATLSFVFGDLFVVYQGVNAQNAFSLDVKVNPLIGLVWWGFAALMLGSALSALGPRQASLREAQVGETHEPASG
ncbi:MAG: cytochrome c biogenesis protein CcsA [Actinomycetia bacterium]|nr:cytochrome c biogenesis protein CcsA [Actinomycetes bacterium]